MNTSKEQNIVIYGVGGHAKVIADIVEKSGQTLLAFVDDDPAQWGKTFLGYPVWSGNEDLIARAARTAFSVIVGIGNNHTRYRLIQQLEKDRIPFGTAVHPTAVTGRDVSIGEGTVIMANAVVNPCSRIGRHCIVNTAVSIDHDCIIGNYVHLSPGAHLGGTVQVGFLTWVGLGASVINNIKIEENAIIGAGAVVIRNVAHDSVVVGNPAVFLKTNPNPFTLSSEINK